METKAIEDAVKDKLAVTLCGKLRVRDPPQREGATRKVLVTW